MTRRDFRSKRKINNRMKRKLAFLFTLVVLALIGLSVRIVYINKTNGEKYTKKVLEQQESTGLTLAYRRGDIYDRNGTVLATSEKVYNVILDPKVLSSGEDEKKEKDCVEPTLTALAKCFPNYTKEDLRRIYTDNKNSSYVVLEKQLTKDEISPFEELQEAKDSKILGVWFEEGYVRKYPYSSLACNVVGYTVSGNVGQYGIEEYYTDTLNGTNGRSYSYLNEDLETEKVIHQPTNGYSVMSTIDITIQQFVENAISDFMQEYDNAYRDGPAAKTVACVMMNPQNGEILAMASNRRYDLNNPYDVVTNGLFTEEEAEGLGDEERLGALNELWRNFAVSDTYEPGSTVKPVTIAAGLESGILTGNETYYCDGAQVVVQGQKPIHCAKRSGHGLITLEGALMFSCNDALMQIAAAEGMENFIKYQRIFNFGLRTGIDLPGESRTDTVVYYVGEDAPYENLKMGPTELATCSFGQGFNASMIQVASAFASCINGGHYYQPHVAKKILDSNGGTVENKEGILLRNTVSEKTSDKLKQYLYNTMYGQPDANGNNATGKKARIAGYAMGGKTGTAQKIPRGQGNYLVSFIGYAPYDNPQVVCYVVVDEPNASYQATSSFAQEIWKKVMQQTLPYLNIYETEEPPEDMIEEYNETHSAQAVTDEEEAASEDEVSGETGEDGTIIDPQTGEPVTPPDVSGDETVDQDTGMLKDLTQDDDYPSGIITDVQPSVGEDLP